MIHSKQHRGCTIQDPGTRGKHQTKTKNPWCTSRAVRCRIEDPGTAGEKQPTFRTARAQRTVRPLSLAPVWSDTRPSLRKGANSYAHCALLLLDSPLKSLPNTAFSVFFDSLPEFVD